MKRDELIEQARATVRSEGAHIAEHEDEIAEIHADAIQVAREVGRIEPNESLLLKHLRSLAARFVGCRKLEHESEPIPEAETVALDVVIDMLSGK